jgi:F-box and WD-40 domain protein 1/11
MDSVQLSPSTSSVPFPTHPRPRYAPQHRPTAFVFTDFASPSFHHRFYTEPSATLPRSAIDFTRADLDFIDGAFFAVPHSMTVTRPPSPAASVDFSIISPPSPEPDFDAGPFQRPRRRQGHRRFHTIYGSPSSPRVVKNIFPRLWGALSSPARKSRAKSTTSGAFVFDPHFSYAEMPPLDGEEGELIDDEACFMGRDEALTNSGIGTSQPFTRPVGLLTSTVITSADIVSMLPSELALLVFRHLDLASILACRSVSREWRAFADDNAVWRDLFFRRDAWKVDLQLAEARGWTLDPQAALSNDFFSFPERDPRTLFPLPALRYPSDTPSPYATPILMTPAPPSPIILLPSPFSPECPISLTPATPPCAQAPLTLPWHRLYRTRQTLDQRWASPSFPPQTMRLSGHTNSVYCVEFDSTRLVSGARDHTVRIWRIIDGECLGTLRGHSGSVLCLKFEKDWDLRGSAPGLLVTGSSDSTVRVWDLSVGPGGAVKGEVREVLKGHTDGVLDLRIDAHWIVSCSKDAHICVWDRATLRLHRTLARHDGPVNSIAMQNGRLVSGSGDGRIMIWDVVSGECMRVFEGHLHGLACIEFKVRLLLLPRCDGERSCVYRATSSSRARTTRTSRSGPRARVSVSARSAGTPTSSARLRSTPSPADSSQPRTICPSASGTCARVALSASFFVTTAATFSTSSSTRARSSGEASLVDESLCRPNIVASVSVDKTIVITDFSEGLDAEVFV